LPNWKAIVKVKSEHLPEAVETEVKVKPLDFFEVNSDAEICPIMES
jgi:hypothetical protein